MPKLVSIFGAPEIGQSAFSHQLSAAIPGSTRFSPYEGFPRPITGEDRMGHAESVYRTIGSLVGQGAETLIIDEDPFDNELITAFVRNTPRDRVEDADAMYTTMSQHFAGLQHRPERSRIHLTMHSRTVVDRVAALALRAGEQGKGLPGVISDTQGLMQPFLASEAYADYLRTSHQDVMTVNIDEPYNLQYIAQQVQGPVI